MEKRITTAITYELPIKEFDCVKKFLSELDEISQQLQKSPYWAAYAAHAINSGLKVVFLHLWTNEEQWVDGFHYSKQMVFEAFIGFYNIGSEMYSIGEFGVDSVEALCKKYEENPDFIFTDLDWDAPKEEIIDEIVSELKKYDYIEAT